MEQGKSVGKPLWSQSFHFHSKQWLLRRKEAGRGWSWRQEEEGSSRSGRSPRRKHGEGWFGLLKSILPILASGRAWAVTTIIAAAIY